MGGMEGYGEGGTGGTGEGGHGESGHVPSGQPAGILAGPLYFPVVTAGVMLAIASLGLLYYGVKTCRKVWKKRSQRRVGCFPRETSCVAHNQDCSTNGEVCINMETGEDVSLDCRTNGDVRINMEAGEEEASMECATDGDIAIEMERARSKETAMEPKMCRIGRKSDYSMIDMFDDEETGTLLLENGSLEGISANPDVNIQIDDRQQVQNQEKENKETTIDNSQNQGPEINQKQSHELEACEVEAQAVDVVETVENLQEQIQPAQPLSCTFLMATRKDESEYDSSSTDEEFEEIEDNLFENNESSKEEVTELSSSVTCWQEWQGENNHKSDDESDGSDSSEEKAFLEARDRERALLYATIKYYQEDQKNETSTEEGLSDVESSDLPSTTYYESSNDGDTELSPSIETCGQERRQQESDQETEDESYGSETIDEEQHPFNFAGTVDHYEVIQLGPTTLSTVIKNATDLDETDYDSGSDFEFDKPEMDEVDYVNQHESLLQEIEKLRLSNYGSSHEVAVAAPSWMTTESEEHLENSADSSEMPTSACRRALNPDLNFLECEQAEEGLMRKKVDNFVAGPTDETTLSSPVDLLGIDPVPGILTAILEPVNRFLPRIVNSDESQMHLVKPEEPAPIHTEDFNKNDQEAIQSEIVRLARPAGFISFLDCWQAGGSPPERKQATLEPQDDDRNTSERCDTELDDSETYARGHESLKDAAAEKEGSSNRSERESSKDENSLQ